jgi:hypothetical protein
LVILDHVADADNTYEEPEPTRRANDSSDEQRCAQFGTDEVLRQNASWNKAHQYATEKHCPKRKNPWQMERRKESDGSTQGCDRGERAQRSRNHAAGWL